jgi:hypothetical protein
VEITLELAEESNYDSRIEFESFESQNRINNNTNPFEEDDDPPVQTPSTSSLKHRFSFSEVKKFIKSRREKSNKGLYLKISTSKLRLSIKVKEEFESVGSECSIKILFHSVYF